jgi:tRNA pseudouridine38/39 synthase
MAAILFLVGQGLEEPEIVDILFDIESVPRKPQVCICSCNDFCCLLTLLGVFVIQYDMASELPLMLHDSEYEAVRLRCWHAICSLLFFVH